VGSGGSFALGEDFCHPTLAAIARRKASSGLGRCLIGRIGFKKDKGQAYLPKVLCG